MSDLTIPEEAIEAVEQLWPSIWLSADVHVWRDKMRLLIEAAAPLIVAAELERLAAEFDQADGQVGHFRLADNLRLRADTIRGGP